MGENAADIMAAIFVPTMLTIVIVSIVVLVYKTRVKKLETLTRIAELGGTVNDDMLKMLGESQNNSHKTDYRKGLIWLAIGLPLTFALGSEDGMVGVTIGLIPVFVGLALLLSGKLRLREP